MLSELITTIIHRPYVFAFLAAYLFLAWKRWGWSRTIFWLISGYLIAWISEVSSVNNGFPYGEYHYVYENLKGELLVFGVPFFDSLSYPFLIFAGYTTAEYILNSPHSPLTLRGEVKGCFLGAFLTMLLDVIIDPIATMGDKWFLGKIHWYVHPGFYFGVPMTNFAGWFLVALAVIVVNRCLSFPRALSGNPVCNKNSMAPRLNHSGMTTSKHTYLYPTFYIAIALFNIAITFWVGEWKLGIASSVILCIILFFTISSNCLNCYRR